MGPSQIRENSRSESDFAACLLMAICRLRSIATARSHALAAAGDFLLGEADVVDGA